MRLFSWFNRPSRNARGTPPHSDQALHTLREAAAEAQRSRLPQMTAALSYRTIFGLLPVIAVGLVVLHKVVEPDDLKMLIHRGISAAGLQNIVIDQTVAQAITDKREELEQSIQGPLSLKELQEQAAVKAPSIDIWINELIERVNGIHFTAIGWIGAIMLFYAAVSMIVEIERAFNQIYRVPRGRSWARRFSNYTTLLVWGPLCLFATFGLQFAASNWLEESATSSVFWASWSLALRTVAQSLQAIISIGLALVLYMVIPNTKVRFLPALAGATLAGLLFEISKFGFGQYVEFSARASYARLYGSLALIPLFLLWIYIAWFIVLFGLQVTYQLQHGRAKTSAQPIFDFGPTVVEPAAGLLVMNAMARAFASGSPQSISMIKTSTGLSEAVVTLVVSRFHERGLLLRVEHENGNPNERLYTLARPPAAIRVGEILELGFELSGGPESNPTLERMRRAQFDAAGAETLADAARLNPDGSSKDAISQPIGTARLLKSSPSGLTNPPNSPTLGGSATTPGTRPATLR